VTQLFVLATPAAVNEGGALQLSGVATLDDDTVTVLAGSNIVWLTPVYPFASVTAEGQATAALVWSNTTGSVTGQYLGVAGVGSVRVLDSNPDNYGLYTGDQIPDSWQVRYFGSNNPQGVAGVTNASRQNNLFSYIADLDPLDSNSVLRVVAISNQPPARVVCFNPASPARLYRLLFSTNLVSGVWTNLPGAGPVVGAIGPMSLTDTNAVAVRYYRIQVQVP